MGDVRFEEPYARVRDAEDRISALAGLQSAEVIRALGGAAREGGVYLANVLTTEALNRQLRLAATFLAVTLGAVVFILMRITLTLAFVASPVDMPEVLRLFVTIGLLLAGAVVAITTYIGARSQGMLVDI